MNGIHRFLSHVVLYTKNMCVQNKIRSNDLFSFLPQFGGVSLS